MGRTDKTGARLRTDNVPTQVSCFVLCYSCSFYQIALTDVPYLVRPD